MKGNVFDFSFEKCWNGWEIVEKKSTMSPGEQTGGFISVRLWFGVKMAKAFRLGFKKVEKNDPAGKKWKKMTRPPPGSRGREW